MRAHGITVFFFYNISALIYFSLHGSDRDLWGVGGRFLAQVSIQILGLIYECNFQIDTNAAHQLAPAQNMNTAENHGNNSSKGARSFASVQDTVCLSPFWCWLWLIECQPACWYTDNNMVSKPYTLLTGRTLPVMSYYLASPGCWCPLHLLLFVNSDSRSNCVWDENISYLFIKIMTWYFV